jgi:hypothetical protein
MEFSNRATQKTKYKILKGVVEAYDKNKGWRVKMSGGILWFSRGKAKDEKRNKRSAGRRSALHDPTLPRRLEHHPLKLMEA